MPMSIYSIAGLTVKMDNVSGRTLKQAKSYLSPNQDENQKVDIVIKITQEEIDNAVKEHPELNQEDWEYMLTGSSFYNQVIAFNGFLLHSSCVVVDDVAYAFSADSGVGKSTHTNLWLKHFGERAYMLNDDKPCIRIIDDKIYACGTPWSGKYDYSTPKIAPLGGICFVERSEENWIKPAKSKDAIFNIFNQTVRKIGPKAMNRLLDVLEKVFDNVPIYELGCNISDEAVLTSYNAMKRKKDEI